MQKLGKTIFGWLWKLLFSFLLLTFLWVLLYKWVAVPLTPLMVIESLSQNNPNDIDHNWIPIESISKNLQLAVICSEDQTFLEHNGFDLKAIEKAIQHNKEGKSIKGASTISQQTAKNVFLWPQRNWLRKGLETYFTFLIELLWDKKRILEVYLNSIEMGSGIYGAQQASLFWFHKNASDLSKAEAAAIAAILPNPRNYYAHPPTNYIQKRKTWILQQMQNYGAFSLSK